MARPSWRPIEALLFLLRLFSTDFATSTSKITLLVTGEAQRKGIRYFVDTTAVCRVIDPLASSAHDPYSEDPPEKMMDAVEFGMVKSEAVWVNVSARRYRSMGSPESRSRLSQLGA